MRYVKTKIPGKNGENKALVCSSQEWENLSVRINEGRFMQEHNENRMAREERKKEMSKTITASWPNTLANLQKRRERLLLDAAEKAENDKINEYNDIMAKRAEEKEEMLDKARKLVLQRTESSRVLNAGLVLSEILYEREKQVEMQKKQQKKIRERELEETARKMKLAQAFHQEQIQEKHNHFTKLELYKKDLDEQMIEVQAERQLQHEEKLREKQDIADIAEELADLQKTEKIQNEERKKNLREEQAQWRKIEAANLQKNLQEVKEQREMNIIYQTVHDRLNKQRIELENKLRKDTLSKREKFAASLMVPKIDYAREERLLKKAVEEGEAKLKRDDKLKTQKREQLRHELQIFKLEATQKAETQAKEQNEIYRWEILKRLAIEESTKKYDEKIAMAKKEQQRECRKILIQQWEERDQRERMEKWDDMTVFEAEKIKEQNIIQNLCEGVKKTCAESGRPMYPVQAAIKQVKKQNGLKETEKIVPFLQSRVPISSIALYETAKK